MSVSGSHTLDLYNELQSFSSLVVLILSLALDCCEYKESALAFTTVCILKYALRMCKTSMQVPLDLLAEAKAAAKDAQEEDMDAD